MSDTKSDKIKDWFFTYGWAVIVVIFAISVIFWFFVIEKNPIFPPSKIENEWKQYCFVGGDIMQTNNIDNVYVGVEARKGMCFIARNITIYENGAKIW